jgi:hypothetical protein
MNDLKKDYPDIFRAAKEAIGGFPGDKEPLFEDEATKLMVKAEELYHKKMAQESGKASGTKAGDPPGGKLS